jgi:hypothetical protein
VGWIAIAARRADKIEAGLLAIYLDAAGPAAPDRRAFLAPSAACRSGPTSGGRSWEPGKGGRRGAERLGAELIRDNHGPRARATLVRYRSSVLAGWRRSGVTTGVRPWSQARSLATLKCFRPR